MRILVCIDDDPVLDEVLYALEWSVHLPRCREIVALHVTSANALFSTVDLRPGRRGEALVERVDKRLSHLGIPVRTLVSNGDPAPEIVRVAEECEADLIVMGACGQRRDFLMGSVSQRVVSTAPTDVLVVRETDLSQHAEDRSQSFRTLLAVDGSLGSEAGIEAFIGKLRARDASIHVVHVVEAIPALWNVGRERDGAFFQSMESRAREVLTRAKRLLECHGLAADCQWRTGSPAAQILAMALQIRADLVVVGSRGHSAIRDMVLGSITHRVLRHAPCTVLCARGWASESAKRSQWSSESWEPEVGTA